jgi:4-hydroxy-tetrahydrodipicolinate synthase
MTAPDSRPAATTPRRLAGVLPIVHVPFDADDRIDRRDLQRELDWIFAAGAQGVGTGMVSEVTRLSADERLLLTDLLVQGVAGRGSVFVSVGAESTSVARGLARAAERAGCDAVMAVPPLASRSSAAALAAYYADIADSVALPVIVQDASGYVGQAIPPEVYVELLDRYGPEKIVFKPEAAPLGPNLSRLRDASGGRARIFEGSGGILLVDSYRRGIVGTMPGVDLLDGVAALWRALEAGAPDAEIYRLALPISGIVALQMQAGLDGFLAIEKHLLVQRGLFASDRRRQPYGWSLDPETARETARLFALMAEAVRASAPR